MIQVSSRYNFFNVRGRSLQILTLKNEIVYWQTDFFIGADISSWIV